MVQGDAKRAKEKTILAKTQPLKSVVFE